MPASLLVLYLSAFILMSCSLSVSMFLSCKVACNSVFRLSDVGCVVTGMFIDYFQLFDCK